MSLLISIIIFCILCVELDDALKANKKLTLDDALDIVTDNEEMADFKQIIHPLEVLDNGDGTFNLLAGNHRIAQKLINGEKDVFVSIQNRPGISVKDQLKKIWDKSK